MVLSENENIVREWCYAKSSAGTNHTLIVTNKRVISETKNNTTTIRDELPINHIKGISYTTRKKFNSLFLFLFIGILAIIFIPIYFSAFNNLVIEGSFIGRFFGSLIITILILIIPVLFGIIPVINFLKKTRKDFFELTFKTNGFYVTLGSSNITSSKSVNFKSLFKKNLSITLNNEIAKDIIDSIGSIILDCQAGIHDKQKDDVI